MYLIMQAENSTLTAFAVAHLKGLLFWVSCGVGIPASPHRMLITRILSYPASLKSHNLIILSGKDGLIETLRVWGRNVVSLHLIRMNIQPLFWRAYMWTRGGLAGGLCELSAWLLIIQNGCKIETFSSYVVCITQLTRESDTQRAHVSSW